MLAAQAMGLGLLWPGLIAADIREGAWVDGTRIFDEPA